MKQICMIEKLPSKRLWHLFFFSLILIRHHRVHNFSANILVMFHKNDVKFPPTTSKKSKHQISVGLSCNIRFHFNFVMMQNMFWGGYVIKIQWFIMHGLLCDYFTVVWKLHKLSRRENKKKSIFGELFYVLSLSLSLFMFMARRMKPIILITDHSAELNEK